MILERVLSLEENMESNYIRFHAHKGHINDVCFFNGGKQALSAGMDGLVKLWSVPSWGLITEFKGHTKSVNSISVSHDLDIIATGSSDCTIRLWSAEGLPLKVIKGHNNTVSSVCISPDGKLLASGSHDGTTRLWTLPEGEELLTLKVNSNSILRVLFTPDGKKLFSGGIGGDIYVWSLSNGELEQKLMGHAIALMSMLLTPDKEHLISSGYEQKLCIWSLKNLKEERSIELDGRDHFPLAISSNGKTLAVGMDYDIALYDFDSGEIVSNIPLMVKAIYSVAFSPNGRYLVAATADGRLNIWDLGK